MPKLGQTIKPRAYRRTNDQLRDRIRESLPQVLEVVLQQALAGDITACKLLLSKSLPDLKPEAERQPLLGIDGDDPRRALLSLLAEGDLDAVTALAVTRALSAPAVRTYPRVPSAAEVAAQAAAQAEINAKLGLVGYD